MESSDEQPTAVLDAPPSPAALAQVPLPRGTAVGRYLLLDPLGVGGMGVVYAAYDPELDRRVAIKLLQPSGRGSASAGQARLVREAQALARLSHPNVVSVYDVGPFGEAVFVAMELVEGHTLRGWLGARQRSWREVVETFRAAGAGLAAAHAAGLVHRDFKPDNVLCGRDGRVRVTDFGLARQVERPGAAEDPQAPEPPSPDRSPTPLTREGLLLGTPSYMAPEQFRRQSADARADQFSFCVALYEALYGARPFPPGLPPASTEGWWQLPLPPRDSRVPAWLRRVVVRGLEADPQARYASMEALLAQLAQDPAARQRRWLGVGAAATAVLLTGGFAWHQVSLRQASLCTGAERKLAGIWDAERKQALQQAFTASGAPSAASTWQRVQHTVDAYAGAWTQMHTEACEATRVRGEQSDEVLSLRMACLERRLDGLRALGGVFASADAALMPQAAKVAHGLAGLESCANVEALRALVPPPQDEPTAARVRALRTQIAEARTLSNAGRYARALEQASAAAQEAGALAYLPLQAEALELLGTLQDSAGDRKAAEHSLTEAVWAAQAGRHDEAGGTAASQLVWLSVEQAQVEQGLRWARQAQATFARMGGSARGESVLMISLGLLHHRQGRYDEAVQHFERARTLREPLGSSEQPQSAVVLNNIAMARLEQGRNREAREHLQQALALYERTIGPEHPVTAHTRLNLGNVLLAEGEDALALQAYEQARPVLWQALGETHPLWADLLVGSGLAQLHLGHLPEARQRFTQGQALYERAYGAQHPAVARPLLQLGRLAHLEGRLPEALALTRRALALQEKVPGTPPRQLADSVLGAAQTLESLGRISEARGHYQRALQGFEKSSGPGSPGYAAALEGLGRLHLLQGRPVEARELLQRALSIREAGQGASHPELEAALSGLGRSHLATGDAARGIALLERALGLCGSARVPAHQAAQTRFALARALWDVPAERSRARALSARAREDWARAGRPQERGQVETWLRATGVVVTAGSP